MCCADKQCTKIRYYATIKIKGSLCNMQHIAVKEEIKQNLNLSSLIAKIFYIC